MTEVAIVGCGPAGLLAAHAVARAGHQPVVLSKEVAPSAHARAVFIHHAIPDLTDSQPDAAMVFQKVGTGHGYAQKVYGDPEAPTSWEKFDVGHVAGWALAPAYERLWRIYRGVVWKCEIDPETATDLPANFPVVINTAPLPSLCVGGHDFPSRPIWVRDGLPARVPDMTNMMLYSGDPLDAWYRCSDLFGTRSTEFGHRAAGAREGIKVLPTNCDCHPSIFRAGRWGRWTPGVLLHNAYFQAERALDVARLAGRLG